MVQIHDVDARIEWNMTLIIRNLPVAPIVFKSS